MRSSEEASNPVPMSLCSAFWEARNRLVRSGELRGNPLYTQMGFRKGQSSPIGNLRTGYQIEGYGQVGIDVSAQVLTGE